MNWKTFLALLSRDARVARRNLIPLLLQTFLQPMLFVFIFGRVMVSSGFMSTAYKSLLLPGIMAISMIFTGVWAVAMPLIGGMTSWIGPVIGAVLLGTIQQLATVTISSALNLLIVGVLLIVFVVIAPNGIVGLVQSRRRARRL